MRPITGIVHATRCGGYAATLAVVAAATLLATTSATAQPCGSTVDDAAFVSKAELRELNATIAGFGLRSPGSAAHNQVLAWLERDWPFDSIEYAPRA